MHSRAIAPLATGMNSAVLSNTAEPENRPQGQLYTPDEPRCKPVDTRPGNSRPSTVSGVPREPRIGRSLFDERNGTGYRQAIGRD
jgi:hypothetical protein